jgi:hypothetical protein
VLPGGENTVHVINAQASVAHGIVNGFQVQRQLAFVG